jgi:3-hydroxybutyryl-CoA dehydrogenase
MSEVRQVGIVGGGFMGSGIAESVARAGIAVAVYEPDEAPLERSRERISTSVDRAVSGRTPC